MTHQLMHITVLSVALGLLAGCGTADKKDKQSEFFTSGSREADQRASQRMAKAEQLDGSGEGAGEKEKKKADGSEKAEEKVPLYERLGGEQGMAKIVEDFT